MEPTNEQPKQADAILTPVKSFIEEQLRGYVEPTRGWGLSRAKYEAALHSALTAGTQKELAQRLGLGYDTIRQWHGQQEFIEAVDEALKEFAVWFSGKLSKLDGTGPVRFGDVPEWGENAARIIGLALEKHGLDLIDQNAAQEIQAKFPAWRYPRTRAVRTMLMFEHDQRDARTVWRDLVARLELHERERQHNAVREMRDFVARVIRTPEATNEEREQALRAFEILVSVSRQEEAQRQERGT